jgi:hypothetical protein
MLDNTNAAAKPPGPPPTTTAVLRAEAGPLLLAAARREELFVFGLPFLVAPPVIPMIVLTVEVDGNDDADSNDDDSNDAAPIAFHAMEKKTIAV